MKKFIVYLLIMLLPLCFLIGCSNDRFQLVKQISYTTNGETKTQSSTCRAHYSASTFITKEEYDVSPASKRIDTHSFNGPSLSMVAKNLKGETYYKIDAKETPTDDLKRYRQVYLYEAKKWQYSKCTEMYYEYYFIYVEVVNDTTIRIKNNKGETTYTVSSYSITEF